MLPVVMVRQNYEFRKLWIFWYREILFLYIKCIINWGKFGLLPWKIQINFKPCLYHFALKSNHPFPCLISNLYLSSQLTCYVNMTHLTSNLKRSSFNNILLFPLPHLKMSSALRHKKNKTKQNVLWAQLTQIFCFGRIPTPFFFFFFFFFKFCQNLIKSAIFLLKSEKFWWKFWKIARIFSQIFCSWNVVFFKVIFVTR